jgi:PAS domain S-box-containing protein
MRSPSDDIADQAPELAPDERAELGRLRALLAHSLEVINLMDASGRIIHRSSAMVRPLGYEDGLMGKNALEIIHPNDRERVARLLGEIVCRLGAAASDVFRVLHADGSYRWLAATATNLLAEPSVQAIVLAYRDVTEQKRAEERAQHAAKLASAGALAAALGHEISSPLTALTLGLEASLRELSSSNPEEARLSLTAALDSVRRISAIAAGLRALVHGGEITPEPVELAVVLERALAQTSYLVGPSVEILDSASAVYVLGEEASLVTVFSNLLANALEAQDATRRPDKVSVRVALEGAEWVCAEVRDTGIGISEEHLGRAFEPFFSTKRELGRSGLGLAVAQRIIEQFGGSIVIGSQVGVGTRVRVRLCRAQRPASESDPILDSQLSVPGRVLVVDDDPLVLRSLVKLLKLDHDVDAAATGREALERVVSGEHYDVILCDVLMPGMSGIELQNELGRLDADLTERVIFITGGGSSEIEGFLRRSGRAFLNKPPDSIRLRALVSRGVRRALARRKK